MVTRTTVLSFTPPVAPEEWQASTSKSALVSEPLPASLIPLGSAYLAHARRAIHKRTFDEDHAHEEEQRRKALEFHNSQNGISLEDFGIEEEDESPVLLASDPKEWKSQDHYAVLGLSSLRYKATQDQIKIAHRRKVLKHHPDKKAGSGDSNDDGFFKCIQKAMEVLSNAEKRRQFDSVDSFYTELEEDVPTVQAFAKRTSEDFFSTFGPVYEREARFSKNPLEEVPMLGSSNDTKASVEAFYDFWYNFDSWRSFEYLDKEVNEGSDSRDDKRYTEKKNKSERARRKKEDNARLRDLVDRTLQLDPRIKRIKQEEKEERERKKLKGKTNGTAPVDAKAKKEAEEAKRKEEEARKEEEEKAAKADAKKAKVAAANAAKKARRQQRTAEEGA